MVKSDIIIKKLTNQISKYFESNGYEDDELLDLGLFHIAHEDNKIDGYTDFYVYAEIPVEEFINLSQKLNDIVMKYDESSYFDIIDSGVYMARVYWNAAKNSSVVNEVYIFTPSNLTKFGEYIAIELEDLYDVEFWVDDIYYNDNYQKLTIKISSDDLHISTSVRIPEDDVDSYQELVELFATKVVKSIKREIDSV